MKTIAKKIKKRLLIIFTAIGMLLSFFLHWGFIIPSMVALIIAIEANEFTWGD